MRKIQDLKGHGDTLLVHSTESKINLLLKAIIKGIKYYVLISFLNDNFNFHADIQ